MKEIKVVVGLRWWFKPCILAWYFVMGIINREATPPSCLFKAGIYTKVVK